ncbi:DNA protecting protein DprA [Cognatishimia activa]|uniref:DNA protecting protein DprA n=2 Tax=Cognatishimia activa TaxID=1715691 RepID=A0A0P1IN27_9RHOB|nr:DNA-processing protein DprA [Cognatishimia activa]CUK25037.1 DNA protecting protein DprA [Cognatishimia activa]
MSQQSSTHPQLRPTTEEEKFLWLRLLRSRRVGPSTFHRLLVEHGGIGAAFAALPRIAAAAGVKDYKPCSAETIEREIEAAQKFGATAIYHGAKDYPTALYDLPDAPPFFWARGDLSLLTKPKIALVGARNASSLGTRMARGLAKDLGENGHVIVSGLARGIDTAAHKAALDTGTIAVFAGGVDVTYPVENTHLAADIAEKGLILSEQPMGLQPQARHFPTRNRIVSGLAKAVVVVEAATKSGSLITARNALDQGRDVLAVPGHPIDTRAAGCNLLLRDGATLVRSAKDVLEAIEPIVPKPQQEELDFAKRPSTARSGAEPLRDISKLHRQVIDRITHAPMAEDHLIRDLDMPTQQAASVLTDLELDGKIARTASGLLIRNG